MLWRVVQQTGHQVNSVEIVVGCLHAAPQTAKATQRPSTRIRRSGSVTWCHSARNTPGQPRGCASGHAPAFNGCLRVVEVRLELVPGQGSGNMACRAVRTASPWCLEGSPARSKRSAVPGWRRDSVPARCAPPGPVRPRFRATTARTSPMAPSLRRTLSGMARQPHPPVQAPMPSATCRHGESLLRAGKGGPCS